MGYARIETVRACMGVILLAASAVAVSAPPLYRWVDDKGKVHYGDSLPPQQSGKGHRELDRLGRVTQDVSKGSPKSEEEKRERQEEGLRATAAQQRRDRALLSTYANVEEIHQARERANRLAGGKIQSLQTRLDEATSAIKKLTAGKPANDPATRKRVEDSQAEIDALVKTIAKQDHELRELNGRFDSDVARFLQLTGQR